MRKFKIFILSLVIAVSSFSIYTDLRAQQGFNGLGNLAYWLSATQWGNSPALWWDTVNNRLTIGRVGTASGTIRLLGTTSGSTDIAVNATGASTTTIAVTAPPFRIYAPKPGYVAYTAINTNGTTLGATTIYCTELWIPVNKTLTGLAILNGTTVGTDSFVVSLYSAVGGTVLANSAQAGTLSAGASVYQEIPFTATYAALGPNDYFGCFQTNGTTATVRMAITSVGEQLLTKGQTGATFGVSPSLVVPTGFTTAVGPYIYAY